MGAGLPIIATLKHLRETGDCIISVEGIFSGTLSYLFNAFGTDERPFSAIVKQAQEAGFTEPDPRDDLSGMDVARKVRSCVLDFVYCYQSEAPCELYVLYIIRSTHRERQKLTELIEDNLHR